jgi:hypothetical protein
MKGLFNKMPALSPDYCGVLSVLFEMNVLPIIHSQGGCVGNYAFIDEIRWLDKSSKFVNSAISEADVVMGDDEKFIEQILNSLALQDVDFSVIISSPIAMIMGADLNAISKTVELRSGVKTLPMETHGLEYYDVGQKKMYSALLDRFLDHSVVPGEQNRVNVIGATSLDNWSEEMNSDFTNILKKMGFEDIAIWGYGDYKHDIQEAGKAKLNIVVSASGIECAKELEEIFGTPAIVGFPIGTIAEKNYNKREAGFAYQFEKEDTDKHILIIADQIYGNEIRQAIFNMYGCKNIDVVSFFHMEESLMVSGDRRIADEEDMEKFLEENPPYEIVIGDQLLKNFFSPDTQYLEMPHLAVSGRINNREIKNVIGKNADKILEKHRHIF